MLAIRSIIDQVSELEEGHVFCMTCKAVSLGLLTQIVILILPVKAEIVKRSFIVRLHRGLSNSKDIVLAYTECQVVEKVKLQPQEQAKSQDQ